MTCEVAASRKALSAGRARERFGRARVRCGAAARLLNLLVWGVLLCIRVIGGIGNVVVIVQEGHGALHLRWGWVPHSSVHAVRWHWWVRGQLLRLLRGITRRVGWVRRYSAFGAIFRLDASINVWWSTVLVLLEVVLHRVLHAERRSCSCVGCQSRVQNSAEFHPPSQR